MENIDKNNINTNAYKNIIRNFNIVIGISFILLISSIYIISIFSINIPKINSDTNLALLETVLSENFIFYIKIFFSFLIPLTFFIFTFLFVLNPISVKSILISFVLIFLTAIYLYNLQYEILLTPLDNTKLFINLIVHIIAANFIMLFISALSYIKYDIKKLNNLYDFYTMIAEIIIWSFLIFFIMFLKFSFDGITGARFRAIVCALISLFLSGFILIGLKPRAFIDFKFFALNKISIILSGQKSGCSCLSF